MTTVAETKERLGQVIRVIEGLPRGAKWTYTWIGCALGYASRDPYFTTRGFKWSTHRGWPTHGKWTGIVACQIFLGIDHEAMKGMFLLPPGVTKDEVVEAIKAHIAGLEG